MLNFPLNNLILFFHFIFPRINFFYKAYRVAVVSLWWLDVPVWITSSKTKIKYFALQKYLRNNVTSQKQKCDLYSRPSFFKTPTNFDQNFENRNFSISLISKNINNCLQKMKTIFFSEKGREGDKFLFYRPLGVVCERWKWSSKWRN